LEAHFSATRSTYDVEVGTQGKARTHNQSQLPRRENSTTTLLSLNRSGENEGQSNLNLASRSPSDHTTPVLSSSKTRCSNLLTEGLTRRSSPLLSTENCMAPTDSNDNRIENMDVDENEETSSTSPSIVMNTSQTSWARRLDTPTSPLKEHIPSQAARDDQEPTTKKRRSDVDHEPNVEEITADVEDRRNEPRTSETTTPKPTTLKQSSLTSYIASNNLRSRLAGFAMPGSQISVSSLPAVDTLDEEVGVEDNPNEEVDELEGDTQPTEEDEVDVDNLPTAREFFPDDVQTRDTGPAQSDELNSKLPVGSDNESDDPSSILSQARATSSATPSTISKKTRVSHPEIIKTNTPGADITLRIDIERMKRAWTQKRNVAAKPDVIVDRMDMDTIPAEAGLSNANDKKAVNALARVIDKQDFDSMDVVGQFNLGFIIVRRRKSSGNQLDDLFIVDQHAADEKYNFETLQETTKIVSQKLFRFVQI